MQFTDRIILPVWKPPITIYNAIVEKEATIVPEKGQVSDTITVSKRFKSGEIFEG